MRTRLLIYAIVLSLMAWSAAAQETGSGSKKSGSKKRSAKAAKKSTADSGEQEGQAAEKAERNDVHWRFRDYPSLRLGRVARIDFHVKFQGDFQRYTPEQRNPSAEIPELNTFDLNRMRVSIEGNFLRHFEYEVEREIREEVSRGNFDNPRHPWRDVYINFRYFRDYQFRIGKFKVPFSMEQLTGPMRLDFIPRSRIADQVAPGRDIGIMMHGRFFERGLSYQVGLFKGDGENTRATRIEPDLDELGREIIVEVPTGQRTFAARLIGTPLRLLRVPEVLRDFHVGGAFTSATVPPGAGREGLKGIRGRTIGEETFFPHIFTHGHRLRIGTEAAWMPGPFSLKGEFIHTSEERRGQGIRSEDLPDLISRGWYVSGSWLITGEKKAEAIDPKRDFIFGRGIGAWEVAIRWEALRFGSAEHPGRPSRGTRAANILGNSDRLWTFGMNWYLNRWTKFQFNAIHERLEDRLQRVPIPGRTEYWTGLVRLQFAM